MASAKVLQFRPPLPRQPAARRKAEIRWQRTGQNCHLGRWHNDPSWKVILTSRPQFREYFMRIEREIDDDLHYPRHWPPPVQWPGDFAAVPLFAEFLSPQSARRAAHEIITQWIAFNKANGLK